MSISCSCGDDEYAWFFSMDEDYSRLATGRRKRCMACESLIDIGATVMRAKRSREPVSEVEERIYGECDSVPLADKYFCEECADLYLSITDAGYCVGIARGVSIRDLWREYRVNEL